MKIMQTNGRLIRILIGILVCSIFSFYTTHASSSEPLDFQEPVNHMTLSGRNDYGTFNLVKRSQFHAGMDVKSALHDPGDFDTPVMASAAGVVHKIFGLENKGANLVRCGGGWESSPYHDSEGNFCSSHHNHGFGMSVIIKHDEHTYTLYAHLNCIEPGIQPGVEVEKGQHIGIMGNSAYEYHYCDSGKCGASKGFGAHLHFEFKKRGILCDRTDYGSHFAYTTGPPEYFGYRDPILYLNKSNITTVAPFPVKLTSNCKLRPGPGAQYGRLTNAYNSGDDLYLSSEFVVHRKAEMQPDACPSGVWYQIFLPTLSSIGDFEGWICADYVTRSLKPMIMVGFSNEAVEVRTDPHQNSRVIAKVYSGQRFVYLEKRTMDSRLKRTWYRISLPNGVKCQTGWICGDHLTRIIHEE